MNHTTITWADLARLKRAAKAAKSTLPGLSHAQRLDTLASANHGVRSYHEMLKRYEAGIDACFAKDGVLHTCRLCGLQFDSSEPDDWDLHAQRHELYEEAGFYLGYLPSQYAERERTKKLGYKWMHAESEHQRREGALAVLLAHFERSLDAAILDKRWRQHPYFEEYVQCALADASFIPSDVRRQLVEEFGERAGVIPKGQSHWPAEVVRQGADGAASLKKLQALRSMATA